MEQTVRKTQIDRLCREVERSVGFRISTPNGFNRLRDCIHARTRQLLSVSTLMRVWDYMQGGSPRETTLDSLAGFIGYESFASFCDAGDADSSGVVIRRHFRVRESLRPGDTVTLTWQPERRCLIRYLGDDRFEVIESANTRLKPGNTFRCCMMVEGEPLFLDDLRQGDNRPSAYVCGKIAGIRFQINTKEDTTF